MAELATQEGDIQISVPAKGPARSTDSRSVFFDGESKGTSVAIQATDAGIRSLVQIESVHAAHEFDFHLGEDVKSLTLNKDGSVFASDSSGGTVAQIDAPWARDASGRSIDTEYEVHGTTLRQTVALDSAAEYPVVADPSIYSCDFYASTCVKLTRSETKSTWGKYSAVGAAAAIAYICTKIPVVLGAAICVGALAAFGASMRDTFKTAASEGKCVELHFLRSAPPALIRWKKVNC